MNAKQKRDVTNLRKLRAKAVEDIVEIARELDIALGGVRIPARVTMCMMRIMARLKIIDKTQEQ